jgi:adenylate cyclase
LVTTSSGVTRLKFLTHWSIAFVTAALILFAHYNDGAIVETARLKQFDFLQQTDTSVLSQDIGIVAIDEAAIEKYGQWPWNRSVLADIILKLREQGAGVIVLPILMSEEDRLGGDMTLAEAIVGNAVVIAQTGSTEVNKNSVPRGVAKINDPLPFLYEWPGMLGPIPLLGDNVDGVGVVNTVPEIDGVIRRVPLIMRIGDDTYPALAVEVIRVATGAPSYQIKSTDAGVEKVRVPGYPIINTDPNARIWLRWNKKFDFISAAEDDFTQFQGRTVIIAPTAAGTTTYVASPVGEKFSFLPAAITLQTVIDGDQITRPWWGSISELSATALIGFLLVLFARFTPYWFSGGVVLLLSGGLLFGTYYAWATYLYLVDITMPLMAVILVGFHAIFNRFVKEFFEKQKIKKQFEGYASPAVVKILQENPDLIKKGTKREVSILFSDLRGFTPLGESFGDDVQGLTRIMNGYMDAITQPVLDADGMIIKYIGDASMHIHNAPIDDERHAHTAVDTGLKMLRAVEKFNEEVIIPEGRPPVGMGAGINTGLGYIGEMGSTKRHSYDILGDAVSTAARIESKCKEYGCLLLVGETTYEVTKDDFFYLKVDDLQVKGKSVGLSIYTVLDLKGEAHEQHASIHNLMHSEYREQKFDSAIAKCEILKGAFDSQMDSYYDMWIERCDYMKNQSLPSDWNGVFVATTK